MGKVFSFITTGQELKENGKMGKEMVKVVMNTQTETYTMENGFLT